MYQVYTAVEINKDSDPRNGQVGAVVSASPVGTPVQVKFDDGETRQYDFADLKAL